MTVVSGLEIVPFWRRNPIWLAMRLPRVVASNRQRIEFDFPNVPARYGTFWQALRSILRLWFRRDLIPFVVLFNGEVVGVATLWSAHIMGRGYQHGQRIADGPNVALWLCARQHRPVTGRISLMSGVLTLLARYIRKHQIPGIPWTLVRPEHTHSIACLTHTESGFGFVEDKPLGDYSRVDGVDVLRALYIAHGWTSAA